MQWRSGDKADWFDDGLFGLPAFLVIEVNRAWSVRWTDVV